MQCYNAKKLSLTYEELLTKNEHSAIVINPQGFIAHLITTNT
jgi:hypothetical protein